MADLRNTVENAPTDAEMAEEKIYFEDGDQLVVDLSNIAEMKFEAVPKGIYHAYVDELNFGLAKDKGDGSKRYGRFEWILTIEDEGPGKGRKHYFYTSFSPKALSGTKSALLLFDPTIFDKPFKPADVANSGEMLGRKVRVKIDHETYQGNTRSKIQYILPYEGETSVEGGASGGGFFS